MGYWRSRSRCRISTHHQTCKFRILEFCTKVTLVSALQQPRWNQRISRSWNQFLRTFRCLHYRQKDKDKSFHWCRQWSSIKPIRSSNLELILFLIYKVAKRQVQQNNGQNNSENSSLQNPNKVNALNFCLRILFFNIGKT